MSRVSVIIPTYHRPDDLNVCLNSILKQTRLPEEVLVIDDGDLGGFPMREQLEAAGIQCVYHKKDKPGLTASRNVGIRISSGDFVFYLDDDVELLPEYLAEILKVFETDPDGAVGGVGAAIVNHPPMTPLKRLRHLYDVFFLLSGFREGRILPSGFFVEFGSTGFPINTVQEVEFLSGGASAFRRAVFEHYRYSEDYKGYCSGEDKDFSFQVLRRFKLLYTPHARLYHYESPAMRRDDFIRGREFVLGKFLFFRDHIQKGGTNVQPGETAPAPGGWWNWLLFAHALFGYTLFRTILAAVKMKKRHWSRVGGILSAIRDIVAGRAETQ